MPEKMLELVDYHFYYGQIHAIKGISLHVDKGGDRLPHRRQRRWKNYDPPLHLWTAGQGRFR